MEELEIWLFINSSFQDTKEKTNMYPWIQKWHEEDLISVEVQPTRNNLVTTRVLPLKLQDLQTNSEWTDLGWAIVHTKTNIKTPKIMWAKTKNQSKKKYKVQRWQKVQLVQETLHRISVYFNLHRNNVWIWFQGKQKNDLSCSYKSIWNWTKYE